jgi:hypothetical protein
LDDDDDDDIGGRQPREQRFLPRRPGVTSTIAEKDDEEFDFLAVYQRMDEQNKKAPPRRPEFVSQLVQAKSKKRRLEQEQKQQQQTQHQQGPSRDDEESSNSDFSQGEETNHPKPIQQQQPQQKPVHLPYQPPLLSADDYQRQVQADLRQEAALLQLSAQTSDLQSVQNVEQRMLEITTLINQFSNLVSEQQEDIEHIHEQAQEVKANITKGQENLVDAAERTKQSKHYMAWSIFVMTMILLFFHTLKG